MYSSSQEQDPTIKVLVATASAYPSSQMDKISKRSVQNTSPSSNDDCFKFDELDNYSCSEESQVYLLAMKLRKSQSLVDVNEKERRSSCQDVVEDDAFNKGYTSEYEHERSLKSFQAINDAEICKESIAEYYNDCNKNVDEAFDSFAGAVHHESLFSIAILEQFDGGEHDNVDDLYADHDCLGRLSSDAKPIFERSHSLGNLMGKNTGSNAVLMSRTRSSENMFSLDYERTEILDGDKNTTCSKFTVNEDAFNLPNTANGSLLDEKKTLFHDGYNELLNKKGNGEYLANKYECDSPSADGNGSFPYANSGETCVASDSNDRFSGMDNEVRDDWYEETQSVDPLVGGDGCLYSSNDAEVNQIQSEMNSTVTEQYLQHASSVLNWNELNPEEFHTRRIEDWISQINIEDKTIVEEQVESPKSVANTEPHHRDDLTTKKHETRNGHGMEVAYNYISTLNSMSQLAQMSNLGLATIPVLSAFVGLRALNLSGNAIVRITAGVLPRGLHMLKLSKNNISTIEGLRELTRLRVLDLCHNRISRIGHGLAYCSSLKELYLAGNKISEVEGLHRLLKLNILDLRSNKISTTKGLRQLAANYSSLQAISLDGNPAQLNVGDAQLKKHLLALLPHLVYYNKQPIRTSRSKEVSERSTRSFSSHKFESGLKSDHRLSRKGTHGTGLHRSSSSSQIRSTNATTSFVKQSKSKHAHSSFVGFKPVDPVSGIGKLLRLQPSNPVRRIQSEGTF